MTDITAPRAFRNFAGVIIEGQRIGLRMVPTRDGRIVADVIARAAATRHDRDSLLTSSTIRDFAPSDIQMHGFILECLATVNEQVPEYREGFTVVLEAGMPVLVEDWLPRISKVGKMSRAVHAVFEQVTGSRALPHRTNVIDQVIADVLLDRRDLKQALDMALENYQDEDLRAALLSNEIRALLARP